MVLSWTGLVLVTDAITAMGLPPGRHSLGQQVIEIQGLHAYVAGVFARQKKRRCCLSPVDGSLSWRVFPQRLLSFRHRHAERQHRHHGHVCPPFQARLRSPWFPAFPFCPFRAAASGEGTFPFCLQAAAGRRLWRRRRSTPPSCWASATRRGIWTTVQTQVAVRLRPRENRLD